MEYTLEDIVDLKFKIKRLYEKMKKTFTFSLFFVIVLTSI